MFKMLPDRIDPADHRRYDHHHNQKVDAPSGTALMLGERIGREREDDSGSIEYRSVREGEVIGECLRA